MYEYSPAWQTLQMLLPPVLLSNPQPVHSPNSPQCLPLRSWLFLVSLKEGVSWQHTEDPEFAQFVDTIGDGAGPEVSLAMLTTTKKIEDVIHFVYPPDILQNPVACLKRSILAPMNCQVNVYNSAILKCVDGEEHMYTYVAKQTPAGLPSYTLTVKMNGIYWLIHNLSIDHGLVKNVHAIVTEVSNWLITMWHIKIHNGIKHMEVNDILIPCISFTYVLPSSHTLLCQQFPLAPRYTTMFNSSQGLNLHAVGLDVTMPVFSCGQLYTTCPESLTIHKLWFEWMQGKQQPLM
jgi:ATP-dependent DNA helicase PIF1